MRVGGNMMRPCIYAIILLRCAWPHLWCKFKEIKMRERKVAIFVQNLTFKIDSEKHII